MSERIEEGSEQPEEIRKMETEKIDDSMATEAPNAPLTSERRIRSDLEEKLPKPYLARALGAVTVDCPTGTPGHNNNGMTVLQQHVSFFDQNKDGVIYPWETFRGLRDIGLDSLTSFVSALVINLLLSFITQQGWMPNPLLPVYINRIHRGKHGSDTATFDPEGRFMPVNLENIFTKYARTQPDKLTYNEVWEMTQANRGAYDPLGWFMSKAEWLLLYNLAKDKDGFLSKEAARGCYDGSLFEYFAKKNKESNKKNR